jgi:peptidyl-prolyl cis-trans isomerase D
MLQRIRENVTGWVAWLIIIFLSIPFAFWGINQYFSDTSGGVAAEVNGEEIPLAVLEQAYQTRYNELVQMFGDQLPTNLINEQVLRREQLERLIMEEILDQKSRELKLRVDNKRMQQAIRNIAAFQVEGEFSPERYRNLLSYNGRTPASFEAAYRRDLGLQQLQQGLVDTGFATDFDAARLVALNDQSRRHAAVSIPDDMFRDDVELTEEDVQAFYDANSDRFLTEETVDIAYVELDRSDYAKEVEVSEAELRETYDLRASDYASQEDRVASHILIEGDGEQSLQSAREVLEKLEQGEGFASLAEEYSDDPVSAKDGGSLGRIARGQLEGPFEDALFALSAGEVSEPVLTDFGYHIIRLDEIKAPELPAFEEIRDELAADLKADRIADRFESDVQQLADITFSDDGSLTSAADEFGIEINTVENVTRASGEGLASNAEIRTAAFAETVLKDNRNSDLIRLSDGNRVVVLRIVAHQPSEPKPLAAVEGDVRAVLLGTRSREMAAELAEQLLGRVRGGESLQDVAASEGVIYRAPSVTTYSEPDISTAYAEALFTADYPTDDSVTYGMTAVEDGDYVVFGLLEVIPGRYAELASSERRTRVQQAERSITNTELAVYLAELRNTADVKVFEKNLRDDAQQ